MRIIAGLFKGRRLNVPRGPETRPTTDGVRETLFNVLREDVDGVRVLDAYAGTGSVGLEALSRGGAAATFVERSRGALALLERNIAACGAAERSTVVREDFLGLSARRGWRQAFELVFLDPPYDTPDLDRAVAEAAALVVPGGRVILEQTRRRPTPAAPRPLVLDRTLTAGDTTLVFYTSPRAF
jgi:16S rRNA (guanine966-N2)-methyltransferase